MRKIWTLIILMAIITGCAGQWPACNEKFPAETMLRSVADDHKMCLQDIGTGLILANGVNISIAKLYTAGQALSAVDGWILELEINQALSGIVFRDLVMDQISGFPELIVLTEVFVPTFSTGQIIDQGSRDILIKYLRDKVKPMLVARVAGLQ